MTIEVKQISDNQFEISWDENDPSESMFNTWSESDFVNALKEYINSIEND